MGVTGGAVLHTLNGSCMVSALADAGPVYCYTWDGECITVGRVRIEASTSVQPVLLVALDDGSSFCVTTYHDVVRRDGGLATIIPPLQMSCLPLYLGRTTNGYLTYRRIGRQHLYMPAPFDQKPWQRVARMVMEWKTGAPVQRGVQVRHKDGNKDNCLPDNLYLFGAPYENKRVDIIERNRDINKLRDKFNVLRDANKSAPDAPPDNHKIVEVRRFGDEIVYDIEAVSDCRNVGINGIFLSVR